MPASWPDRQRATPEGPRRRPVCLWPLLVLPIIGLCAGALSAFFRRPLASPQAGFQATIVASIYGLAAGSAVMTLVALGFLVARLAVRRFTIRSVLIAIALVALLLGGLRGCAP